MGWVVGHLIGWLREHLNDGLLSNTETHVGQAVNAQLVVRLTFIPTPTKERTVLLVPPSEVSRLTVDFSAYLFL